MSDHFNVKIFTNEKSPMIFVDDN